METLTLSPDRRIESYVQNIVILENSVEDKTSVLPFFADGSPGIMFQQAPHGVYLHPKNKKLSKLFLYGQTIHPIELSVKGPYRLIVFQLYPFAAKGLIGVNPKELNDECFDLTKIPNQNVDKIVNDLNNTTNVKKQVQMITSLFVSLIKEKSSNPDSRIQLAISLMISCRGKLTINSLREKVNITDRTF